MTSVGKMADVAGSNPSSGTYRYYTHDHLGSTRALWSQAKASLGTYEYTPYGRTYWTSGPSISHMYTGHLWDGTAQLYYAPYRYYSPATARWLTRDPLGMVDGPNVYAYVMGNPVTYYDPLGLTTVDDCNDEYDECCDSVRALPPGDKVRRAIGWASLRNRICSLSWESGR
ncbi:MAG: RHS repeat-associated core domain-containing protein [Candidatus Hydrogenedentes bacterium]|nr:RHS repeat-associated core domain-containing protein [Candidatus Hydrogenedentota bacterium]